MQKIPDAMIVHIVVYILLLSITNCYAAININLFIIYLFFIIKVSARR